MTEEQEEALGALRGAVEEIDELHQRLYTRLNQGDIPWDAGNDISGEYGGDFDRIARSVKEAEAALSKSFGEVEARGRQPERERRLSMDDIAHGFREQACRE